MNLEITFLADDYTEKADKEHIFISMPVLQGNTIKEKVKNFFIVPSLSGLIFNAFAVGVLIGILFGAT